MTVEGKQSVIASTTVSGDIVDRKEREGDEEEEEVDNVRTWKEAGREGEEAGRGGMKREIKCITKRS